MFDWWMGAFGDLRKALDESGARRAGPDGCLYPNEMFELEEGEMVAFVPVTTPAAGSGRVQAYQLPAVELAIMVHPGSYDELDQTYGALGTHVAERAIGVEGPIRELYLVGPFDVEDAREPGAPSWAGRCSGPADARPGAATSAAGSAACRRPRDRQSAGCAPPAWPPGEPPGCQPPSAGPRPPAARRWRAGPRRSGAGGFVARALLFSTSACVPRVGHA